MASTERTPLTSTTEPAPSYVFYTNPSRLYRSRVRKYQCCLCASLLAVFVIALVITVSYSMNHDTQDNTTTSTSTSTTPASTTPASTTPASTTPTTTASTATTATTKPSLNLSQAGSIPTLVRTNFNLSLPLPSDDNDTIQWPDYKPSRQKDMNAAIEVGKAGLRTRDVMEITTKALEVNTPSSRHQAAVGTGKQATKYARAGYIEDVATREYFKGNKILARKTMGRGPPLTGDWLPPEVCSDAPRFVDLCTKTPYRSIDGVCNNPNHPRKWGVALRPFRRLLPPDYADGVSEPRVSSDGSPLPSARAVSVLVHRPVYMDDPLFTVMLAVWGQFMDHDITATAQSKGANMSTISCCYAIDKPETMHPECFPVRLADGDPYYMQYNMSCMEFVRSAPAPMCSLGPREQLNQATAFLDGSVVYGSDAELTNSLRSFNGGQLRMETTADGRTLLPFDVNPNDGCNRKEQAKKNRYCFLSGDKRANENLHLTSMHLVFARHHNYLVNKLQKYNPSWDDERLFQEGRRILGAQMQHITYKEFLPVLFGDKLMTQLNIKLKDTGYHDVYNASVDPSVANGFASSAFRFAHTLLPSLFKSLDNNKTAPDYVELHKLLFDPFKLYTPGNMDNAIRGAVDTNCQKIDTFFTTEITEKLFEGSCEAVNETKEVETMKPHVPGLDLVSLNIQRGRDHGLPSYPHWRKLCGLTVPQNFSDLYSIMDADTVLRLASMYKSVDDVDFYSGALSEIPMNGVVLGPTVLCVLADQFYRTKIGDRFWYETPLKPQAFTPEQLQEIRKTTLAGILCTNSDDIEAAQPWVMRLKKTGNYPVPCYGDVILHPNMAMWQEIDGSFISISNDDQSTPSQHSKTQHTATTDESTDNDDEEMGMWPDPGVKDIAKDDEEIGLWSVANGIVKKDSLTPKKINKDKYVKYKFTVISGSITAVANASPPVVWWNGSLPINISRTPFDSVSNVTQTADAFGDLPVFGEGILWKVTVRNSTEGTHINGTFSLPTFIHGPTLTVKWWTGVFLFNIKTDSDLTIVQETTLFSSRMYFHSQKTIRDNTSNTSQKPNQTPDLRIKASDPPSSEVVQSAKRLPVILVGSNQGKDQFMWSGDVLLLVNTTNSQ